MRWESFSLEVEVSILIKLTASMAGVELNSEPQNIEYRTAEYRREDSLCSVFFKIDRSTQKLTTGRIHYFDIRFFRVSFSIRSAVFLAGGWAEP